MGEDILSLLLILSKRGDDLAWVHGFDELAQFFSIAVFRVGRVHEKDSLPDLLRATVTPGAGIVPPGT
jgi:hypothetical protein